jgi:hypothetical protein
MHRKREREREKREMNRKGDGEREREREKQGRLVRNRPSLRAGLCYKCEVSHINPNMQVKLITCVY